MSGEGYIITPRVLLNQVEQCCVLIFSSLPLAYTGFVSCHRAISKIKRPYPEVKLLLLYIDQDTSLANTTHKLRLGINSLHGGTTVHDSQNPVISTIGRTRTCMSHPCTSPLELSAIIRRQQHLAHEHTKTATLLQLLGQLFDLS